MKKPKRGRQTAEISGGMVSTKAQKVFISWSGDQSKRLGAAIKQWLPKVLQLVEVYFSDTDIEVGSRWYNEIVDALEKSDAGLVILTPENISRQWIMFEAGAIARSVERGRVCPILFGLKKSDLKGPLGFFQSVEFVQEDFRKLLRTLNSGRLGEADFNDVFDTWWPKLKEKVEAILSSQPHTPAPHREEKELLEEVVINTRTILRELQAPRPLQIFAPNREIEAYARALRGDKPATGDVGNWREGGVLGDLTAKSE
jgi:hypothetical protein